MLGALFFGKQTFNRQQLHARIFFLVRAFVKARAGGVLDPALGAIVQRNEQRNVRAFALPRSPLLKGGAAASP
jgi:hypothetical protein